MPIATQSVPRHTPAPTANVNTAESLLQMCGFRAVPLCPSEIASSSVPTQKHHQVSGEGELEVLNGATNCFTAVHRDKIKVGDVVRVKSGQVIPADMLLIWSTNSLQTAISTYWYDGEAVPLLRMIASIPSLPVSLLGTGCAPNQGSSSASASNHNPVAQLRAAGQFYVSTPERELEKLTVHFVPPGSQAYSTFGSRSLLPEGSTLMNADALGVVLYTGNETKYALCPNKRVMPARAPRQSTTTTATSPQSCGSASTSSSSSSSSSSSDVAVQSVNSPTSTVLTVSSHDFELSTGLRWSDQFHNVEDDGNCAMTAFWLGLKTLLEVSPSLRLTDNEGLCTCSRDFRHAALEAIFADPNYLTCLENQLQLWLELDAAVLMSTVEDFFVLPDALQEQILLLNQNCQFTGVPADMEDLVHRYQQALLTTRMLNGREVYVPLGQLEMETLCELYQVRLQIIKSESISGLGPLESVDPRTIHAKYILDQNRQYPRMVRLLNVNSNHYMVHLPQAMLTN